MKNPEIIFVSYHIESGEPRMVVNSQGDPIDLNDQAWNPPGHAQLHLDAKYYHTLDHEGLKAHFDVNIPLHKEAMLTGKEFVEVQASA